MPQSCSTDDTAQQSYIAPDWTFMTAMEYTSTPYDDSDAYVYDYDYNYDDSMISPTSTLPPLHINRTTTVTVEVAPRNMRSSSSSPISSSSSASSSYPVRTSCYSSDGSTLSGTTTMTGLHFDAVANHHQHQQHQHQQQYTYLDSPPDSTASPGSSPPPPPPPPQFVLATGDPVYFEYGYSSSSSSGGRGGGGGLIYGSLAGGAADRGKADYDIDIVDIDDALQPAEPTFPTVQYSPERERERDRDRRRPRRRSIEPYSPYGNSGGGGGGGDDAGFARRIGHHDHGRSTTKRTY